MDILSSYTYNLHTRRFIESKFDKMTFDLVRGIFIVLCSLVHIRSKCSNTLSDMLKRVIRREVVPIVV